LAFFHTSYQTIVFTFMAQKNKELSETFCLEAPETYQYLKQSGCIHLPGMDDSCRFDDLRLAFNVLQIPLTMCEGIFATLSAILWLGNLEFEVKEFISS